MLYARGVLSALLHAHNKKFAQRSREKKNVKIEAYLPHRKEKTP